MKSVPDIGKIVLGTASLGMKYGINATLEIDEQGAEEILNISHDVGIRFLDTALDYGHAHSRIKSFERKFNKRFKVATKAKCDGPLSLENNLHLCLESLGRTRMDAFLFHRYSDFLGAENREFIRKKQEDGIVEKVGVSLYTIEELKHVVDMFSDNVNIIQIPFNVLDKAASKFKLLEIAKSKGIEVYARSIFLQGLLLKSLHISWGNLEHMKGHIQQLKTLADNYGVSMQALCLRYTISKSYIDKVIIGVNDSLELKKNVDSLSIEVAPEMLKKIDEMHVEDTFSLDPRNWK